MALPGSRPSRANLSAATSGPRRGVPPAPASVPARNAGSALRPGIRSSGIQNSAPMPADSPAKPMGSALRPGVRASGIRGGVAAPVSDPAESNPQRTTRPAIKRKAAPRRSFSAGNEDGMYRLMRIGIFVVVMIVLGLLRAGSSRPSANQTYFNRMADLDHRINDHSFENPKALRLQIQSLPISGVTDAKLREYHEMLLKFVDSVDKEDGPAAMALLPRLDKLVDEINATYARR